MNKTIEKLPKEFTGTGEVKGFTFRQIFEGTDGYIYQVNNQHYEVFQKRTAKKLIDFNQRIYSDIEYKERYPKANDFGVWAYTEANIMNAYKRLYQLSHHPEVEVEQ